MIAICIGHGRPVDQGADSVEGISEEEWNTKIAHKVAGKLLSRGHACQVVGDYQGATYGGAMRWLAKYLKGMGATCAVELHFNCSDSPQSNGHEWLHCGSPGGRKLAMYLDARMRKAFPQIRARGLQELNPKKNGWAFVNGTHCPAVICEPGFGSNQQDWDLLDDHQDLYATVIADGICDWMGGRR